MGSYGRDFFHKTSVSAILENAIERVDKRMVPPSHTQKANFKTLLSNLGIGQ